MPASEIDAIFASKGKSSAAAPAASSSSSSQAPEKKKKKKVKSAKRKRDADADPEPDEAAPPKPAKRKVPETVFDPSAAAGAPPAKEGKARRADKPVAVAAKSKKPTKDREEDQRFKDSRGTGPRRKTEEGFSIFKEDELGITDQGGDTPLCPFDCQCCF